ncbi:helix-turn-helix transcriptional regulator [Aestuariibacter sp. AA17]|uniref:Helix-turn-helix transcriptional regulator n=1 Tax=Fluctibacter corallii TaxID=2984329 RepID=A0ABT3A794_9ALTE|nr:helix-turn-helix transcriptional regulator [Aestuariibacter sp. AA17]MCV2884560.1 helix-turn-helix transcriptional regulator [Aestuariibacter sp. AA17]
MSELNKNLNRLSRREAQIAEKISLGLTNSAIADQLFISERTVKFHCTNIFKKLDVENRKVLIATHAGVFNQLNQEVQTAMQ